jgi:predicted nucleic acid-binding Zn ribbon protein
VAAEETNLDLLEAFSEDERGECSSCGARACVKLREAPATFCLSCGAVRVGGMRLDVGRNVPVEI